MKVLVVACLVCLAAVSSATVARPAANEGLIAFTRPA